MLRPSNSNDSSLPNSAVTSNRHSLKDDRTTEFCRTGLLTVPHLFRSHYWHQRATADEYAIRQVVAAQLRAGNRRLI